MNKELLNKLGDTDVQLLKKKCSSSNSIYTEVERVPNMH